MQPKFTLQKRYGVLGKIVAVAMIFAFTAQPSFSQNGRSANPKAPAKTTAEAYKEKLQMARAMQANPNVDNDVQAAPRRISVSTARTEAVCQTFTGSLAAGDATMPNRLFRPGATSSCTVPYAFPGTFAVTGGVFFDVFTYTNTTGLTQCGTFSLTTTDLTNANIGFGVWSNTFDPANMATNYLADPGVTTGTPQTAPLTFQATIASGATIKIPVWSANASTAATGTASNYTVTIDFPICSSSPCSGTPTPGNTISSVPTVCPGVNFTLSPQNATPGAGVSYQWQSSPDGVAWTDIAGATGATRVQSQTAATYYRVRVTCGANVGFSTGVQVLLTPVTGCYCVPTYTNGCTFGDYIARVVLLTLDNSSTCSTPPFTYYSAVAAPTVIRGATYPLVVTVGPDTFGQFVGAWADFNQDGDFADAGEFLGVSGNAGASGTVTIPITIPATATLGSTRLRIRGGDDVAPSSGQSCGASNSTFGEAEDYNINIAPCVQGVITGQPAAASTACSGNTSFTVTATGSALVYGWEYRVNATSPWQNVTNGGVYSGATTNQLTLTNVPSSMTGYQYRALISGPCTAVDFSNPATLTVTPLVATVNPTSATICTGSIQQLTLTNASSPATVTGTNTTVTNIPDATPTGVQSSITISGIPAGAIVTNVSVTMNINHTWVGDLDINLIAPNGGNLNLVGSLDGGTGSNGTDNFVNTVISSTSTTPISGAAAPRTGTFAAEKRAGYGPTGNTQNVTDWTGLIGTLNGTWKLAVADFFSLDVGTIQNWSISITYGAPAAGVWTSNPAAPNTMFTNSAATIPYVAGTPVNTIWVKPTVNTVYSVVYSTPTPCTSAATNIPVTVVNPVSAVVAPVNKSACVGGSTSFTASATGGPFTYAWEVSTDGGATWSSVAGGTNGTLTLTGITQTMNNYRYRAIISAPPCSGSTTTSAAVLTVNALPTVTISASSLSITPGVNSTITATSTPAAASPTSYTWFYNGSQIVTTPATNTNSIVRTVDQLGSYQARVTDVNGCVNVSNILVLGAQSSDRLWIYPNPSSGQFQVRVYYDGPYADIRHVSIYNAKGQLVQRKQFDLTVDQMPYLQMNFDMSNFAAGTYVVKVEEKYTGKTKSGLLVIQ